MNDTLTHNFPRFPLVYYFPMSPKRAPVLQPLSRDHLIALYHAHRLVQAASGNERFNLNECIEGFKNAWHDEIATHFADEERLFPELSISHESLERLYTEHSSLRQKVLSLYFSPTSETALSLGELLDAHVRWEEHFLFPEIENSLSEHQLSRLDAATTAIEKSRSRKL
jgi:hypothetical protein